MCINLKDSGYTTVDISHLPFQVVHIEGVIGYKDPHFWFHTSSKTMGSLHLQITHNVVEQKLISQVIA